MVNSLLTAAGEPVAIGLTKVSASQVVEYQRCPRRWYNAYLLGMREPASDAMLRGTAIHALVERYLKGERDWGIVDGKLSPYLKIVEAGLPHLPPRGEEGIKVEEWIELPTRRAGLRFVGRYDSIDWRAPRVYDCKTTSDFRYAKGPVEMAGDVQLNAYARHVLDKDTEQRRVYLRLVYMRTRGAAKALPLEVSVAPDQVLTTWENTLDIVDDMDAIARSTIASAQELRPNTTNCHAYNKPCPYLRMCTGEGPEIPVEWLKIGANRFHEKARADAARIDPQPTGGADMDEKGFTEEEKKLPLKERMRIQAEYRAGKSGDAPPAGEPDKKWQCYICSRCNGRKYAPSTVPGASPGAFLVCDVCAGLGHVQAARSAHDPADLALICRCTEKEVVAECPLAPAGKHARGSVVRAGDLMRAGEASIVPPDAPPRTSTPEEIAAEEAKVKKPRAKKTAAPDLQIKIKVEGEDGTMKPLKVEEVTASGSVSTATTFSPKPTPTNGHKKTLALYVDSMPQKGAHAGAAVDFAEWLAPIAAAVAAKAGKADWRQIEYTAEGDLCAAVRAAVDTLPEAVIVTGTSRSRAAFLEAVMPHATQITRGV